MLVNDLPMLYQPTGEWITKAACANLPTEWWFPRREDTGNQWKVALQICSTCQVRTECLEHAMVNRIDYGIWGGTTAQQRVRRMPRLKFNRPLRQIVHGTASGYSAHLRNPEYWGSPCEQCRLANREAKRAAAARRRVAGSLNKAIP